MTRAYFTGALGAGLALTVVASLALGSRMVAPDMVIDALVGGPHSRAGADITHLVWGLRIPRTVLAAAAGASLAVAGALSQSWTRNYLADPGFVGITAGAACAVAAGIALSGGLGPGMRSVLALTGAAAAVLVVGTVARRTGDPLTLILAGVGVSAALHAVTMLITLNSLQALDAMRHWTVGSTFGRGWSDVAIAVAGLVVGGIIAACAARPLDLLEMGAETAASLGASPAAARALAAASIIVLAGSATAAVGPVAFVGFAAAHLVRRVTGPSLCALLVPAALCGAGLTLLADVVGRLILRPGEVEMSVVLALIGAPILIVAVRRKAGR